LRDVDLLARASRSTSVHCNLSIGTLDPSVWKATEPGTPHPKRRVEAVRRLNDAGVECGVLIAPIIPGLSDGDEQLDEVAQACLDAGATSINPVVLHLRPGVREHFLSWLKTKDASLAHSLENRYRGSYLSAADQATITDRIKQRVARASDNIDRWAHG
ncbi:MAG TPA: hypothetical protein VEJ87_10275, partial [Acidimicrobiales bacterium]|nr:hypothetical protein [Acidimicrobiales bacterium]